MGIGAGGWSGLQSVKCRSSGRLSWWLWPRLAAAGWGAVCRAQGSSSTAPVHSGDLPVADTAVSGHAWARAHLRGSGRLIHEHPARAQKCSGQSLPGRVTARRGPEPRVRPSASCPDPAARWHLCRAWRNMHCVGCFLRRGRWGAAPPWSRAPGKAGGHGDIPGGELRSVNMAWLQASLPAGGRGGGCRASEPFLGTRGVGICVPAGHSGTPRSPFRVPRCRPKWKVSFCADLMQWKPTQNWPRPHACTGVSGVHRCVRCAQVCQVCTGVSAVPSQATWCGFSLATSSRMEAGWGAPVRHWARVSKDPRTMLQQLSKNEGCRAGLAITLRVRFKM